MKEKGRTCYEMGMAFWQEKCTSAWEKHKTAETLFDKAGALEEFEIASLKLGHLRRRKKWKLIR